MKPRHQKLLFGSALAGAIVIGLIVVLALLLSHHSQGVRVRPNHDVAKSLGEQLSGAQAPQIKTSIDKAVAEIRSEDQQKIASLKTQIHTLKGGSQSDAQKLKSTISSLQDHFAKKLSDIKLGLESKLQAFKDSHTSHLSGGYGDVHVGSKTSSSQGREITTFNREQVIWVKDISVPPKPKDPDALSHWSPFGDGSNLISKSKADNTSDISGSEAKAKPKPIPFYTIPPNSMMTGVIPLQPLIGRIPKGDTAQIYQPFHAMFVTEHPTLMAQGHEAPLPLAKMTGTALCLGDFMSRSVSCQVKSLTFIFDDGHFQVINAKEDKGGRDDFTSGLGTLADHFGNPEIKGDLKTSLGLRLAVTGVSAGVSAYGQALAQAQVQNYGNSAISTLQRINNANSYAQGQALSGVAQGAQKEWEDISKNMYDYVFVPNWNPDTKRLIRLNIIVNKEIDINYDKTARKIDYANTLKSTNSNILS